MKKDGIYRFSLQFGTNTEEQIRAGELLERLGNKKSQIIVAALNEYMAVHPELGHRDCKLEIKSSPVYDEEKIKQVIEDILQHKFGNARIKDTTEDIQENIADDISRMLDNIDLFR